MTTYRSPRTGSTILSPSSPCDVVSATADEFSRIQILESSRKGRISYDNGWDKNPNSFLKLVSGVQQTEDYQKSRILERTYQITVKSNQRASQQRRRSRILNACNDNTDFGDDDNSSCSSSTANEFFNNEYYESSSATEPNTPLSSSPILDKKVRFPEFHDGPEGFQKTGKSSEFIRRSISRQDNIRSPGDDQKSLNSKYRDVNVSKSPVTSQITSPLVGRILKRGLGIREEEYDDNECAIGFSQDSSVYLTVIKSMDEMNAHYDTMLEDRIRARRRSYLELKEKRQEIEISPSRKSFLKPEQEKRIQIAEMEAKQKMEAFKLKQQIERKKNEEVNKAKVAERLKIIQEYKRREEEATAAAKAAEEKAAAEAAAKDVEKQKLEAEQKVKEEAEKSQAAVVAAQKQKESIAAAAVAAATAAQPSGKGFEVPPEFQGFVLASDLQRYLKSQQLLTEYKEKFAHITAKTAATKDYYSQALRIVNTTLNSIASSPEHNRSKVNQLVCLLSGKPVAVGDSAGANFMSTTQPNGDVFVATLLAHRFVKKSETEITKGCASVEPLAQLGVSVALNCPHWAMLVRAYFYKMCPFLVPFSFPRRDMSIEEYAASMDHSIKGSESAINQALLDKWNGYCTLYALMVKVIERQKITSLGEATEFFSVREVWRILATIMKLTPQVDLTATTIQVLLESVGDRLYASYGAQFKKMIVFLTTNFIPKIRQVTPAGKAAAITRLELFLEKKIQSGFL